MTGHRVVPAVPALGGICWAVCAWEIKKARNGPRPYEVALPGSGLVGNDGRAPLKVAWLGDSLAAGLGCDELPDTPAHLVARMLERPVEVRMLAVPGSKASDVLEEQVPQLRGDEDLVVVCVGANDVANLTRRQVYASQLDEILAATASVPTVLLSLPDMGMADRLAQPLRGVAGAYARWFDAARRRIAARHAHVRCVDIASRPEKVSRREGRTMLCADRFHPGPQGYRVWAERIATICDEVLTGTPVPALA